MKKALLSDLLSLPPHERADIAAKLWDSLRQADRERALTALLADVTQRRADQIGLHTSMREQGIDSLQLIILRERLQTVLGLVFSDQEWSDLDTPARILAKEPGRIQEPPPHFGTRATRESSTGGNVAAARIEEALEIGMPLTGRNNLAETPLLQYVGDIRWRHISDVMGVPSREICDEDGERLYATFFYVELAFPTARPMSSFGENDRFAVVSTLARYGTSMVDGITYLVPATGAGVDVKHLELGGGSAPPSVSASAAKGIPAARLSNIFVKQFGGAEWLKKGRPAHPGFIRIPELVDPPDTYALTKQAEHAGRFLTPDSTWLPMTDGPVNREYRLVPDRDLNGAGLVYFANYPMFLDICERDVLRSGRWPLTDRIADRRTLLHRRSAYLNNAAAQDTLQIAIEPWLRAVEHDGLLDLHLRVNYRMHRQSDNRLMMVSSADKIVPAVDPAHVPADVVSRSNSRSR